MAAQDIVIIGFVGFLAWFLPQFQLIKKRVVFEVLKSSAEYPQSDIFKERKTNPKLHLDNIKRKLDENDISGLLAIIFEDMELNLCEINMEARLILACVLANPKIFFLKDIDFIIISRMGAEVLVLEMLPLIKNNDYVLIVNKATSAAPRISRALLIDINTFRSSWLKTSRKLFAVLFGVGMTLAYNIPWRELMK